MASLPAKIGRYEIIEPLGQGGMGSVLLAHDPQLDRRVAIKVLIDDNQELRERFAREGRSAAVLRHQNIVTIFDVGEHEGRPFLAMEYVDGTPLATLIEQRQPVTLIRKLEIIEELCNGLGFAHKSGIVHRDIKPANISVASDGTVKILDFGIARRAQTDELTVAGTVIGTLNYMSPEQISGRRVDHRSDIFAVGALCYELLSGERAFPGDFSNGLYNRIVNEPPEPLSSIAPALDREVIAIVDRALAKRPEDRFQELASMSKAVAAVRRRIEVVEAAASTVLLAVPPSGAPPSAAKTTRGMSAGAELAETAASAPPAISPAAAATEIAPVAPAVGQRGAPSLDSGTRGSERSRRALLAAAVVAVGIVAYLLLAHRESADQPSTNPAAASATPETAPPASASTQQPVAEPERGPESGPAPADARQPAPTTTAQAAKGQVSSPASAPSNGDAQSERTGPVTSQIPTPPSPAVTRKECDDLLARYGEGSVSKEEYSRRSKELKCTK